MTALIGIDDMVALEFLKRDPLKYLAEIVQIESNQPPCPRQVFGDSGTPDAIMMVTDYSDDIGVFFSPCGDAFLTKALSFLGHSFDEFALRSIDPHLLEHEQVTRWTVAHTRQHYSYLACTSCERLPPVSGRCRLLGADDRDLFLRYPHPIERKRPEAAQIFQWLVLNGGGEIFGMEHDGELHGYLSCTPEYERIWDVEFIHVREEYRGRGLGSELAAAYARERLDNGQVAYYSAPANRASERVAEKAGFHCCRELTCVRLRPNRMRRIT